MVRFAGRQPATARISWRAIVRDPHQPDLRACVVALALLFCCACSRHRESKARERTSGIILIVIDALRADHVSAYGYERATTPNLDAIARDGIVFEQAFSAANWTKPSTASLFTGRLPHHHGCLVGHLRREKAGSVVADLLPDELTTFAELLQEHGWYTCGLTENKHITERYGFGQGFDRYGYERLGQLGSWISAAPPGKPFLAFAHIMGPHEPYDLPQDQSFAPYRDKFGSFASAIDFTTFDYKRQTSFSDDDLGRARALYDAKLNWVDELQIGPLLARLHRKGLYDSCWLVVTSDHGEELGEHGRIGHGEVLYNESLHVPLIVKPPRDYPGMRPGTRVATRVSTISLYPTLAEIATGASVPSDGVSLMAALRGEPLEDRPLIAEYGRFQKGRLHAATIIAGSHKLIRFYDPPAPSLLFDLERDPGERSPLPSSDPAVRPLTELLARGFNDDGIVNVTTVETTVQEDDVRDLDAIGYK
jgi:arylsulfatase A-like enzyme